jgi:hypothetical protein
MERESSGPVAIVSRGYIICGLALAAVSTLRNWIDQSFRCGAVLTLLITSGREQIDRMTNTATDAAFQDR